MLRKGFVSNSSSSSFILSYNENYVIEGASNIVKYIKDNPNKDILFYDKDYYEGDFVVTLDSDLRSIIRKYSDEFIAKESSSDSKYIAYTGEIIRNSKYLENQTTLLMPFGERDYEEYLEQEGDGNYDFRQDPYSSNKFENFIQGEIDSLEKKFPNRKAKFIWIDYKIQGDRLDTVEFFDMYISSEDSYDVFLAKDNYVDPYEDTSYLPYAICYKKRLTNKADIIEYLSYTYTKDCNVGICWLSEPYEYVLGRYSDIEMFVLGEKEINYLVDHQDSFFDNTLNVSLFVDYRCYKNNIYIQQSDVGREMILRRGNFKEITGCFEDFKMVFFSDPDSD